MSRENKAFINKIRKEMGKEYESLKAFLKNFNVDFLCHWFSISTPFAFAQASTAEQGWGSR